VDIVRFREPGLKGGNVVGFVDRDRYPYDVGELFVTELMVCHSAAGYFIGRMCWDKELSFEDQFSRESGYYPTATVAQKALKEGFEVRECSENEMAYNEGLPRPGAT